MEIKLVSGGKGEGWITILVREYTPLRWWLSKQKLEAKSYQNTRTTKSTGYTKCCNGNWCHICCCRCLQYDPG